MKGTVNREKYVFCAGMALLALLQTDRAIAQGGALPATATTANDLTASVEAERLRLEAKLAVSLRPVTAAEAAPIASASSPAVGKLLPDISLVLFGLTSWTSGVPTPRAEGHDPHGVEDGGLQFQLQELEIAFQSFIDPYARADIFLAVTLEEIELEEAYLTTLALPVALKARAGAFLTPFGRFNTQHYLETQPFVDQPLPNRWMFGSEQLRGLGFELSWLAPLPWYVEFLASFQTAQNENSFGVAVEDARSVSDYLQAGRVQQFFELSDNLSLQLGLSGARGPSPVTAVDWPARTMLGGGDVYLKWRDPSSRRYVSLQAEYIGRRTKYTDGTVIHGGAYAAATGRLARHWEVAVRADRMGLPASFQGRRGIGLGASEWSSPVRQSRGSASASYLPSEFQRWRLQYNYDVLDGTTGLKPDEPLFAERQKPVHELFLQYQFAIGAHGGHPF